MNKDLTAEELELLKRLIRPHSGRVPAEEFDLRISLWQKLIPADSAAATRSTADAE